MGFVKTGVVVAFKASEYDFLSQSPKPDEYEKSLLKLCMDEDILLKPENRFEISEFPGFICRIPRKHFDRRVILLIDEYDMPPVYASMYGCHDKMVMPAPISLTF